MSLVSFHCCLHSAASCMNSHCQQYDLAVPHAGSDPLRRVRFTAGPIVFAVYTGWLLISTAQVHLAVSLQYRRTFVSIVISVRLPCSSNLQNALLLIPVLSKASENWYLLKRLIDLIWQTANYIFTFHSLAFLSTYNRKQWGRCTSSLKSCPPSVYHT